MLSAGQEGRIRRALELRDAGFSLGRVRVGADRIEAVYRAADGTEFEVAAHTAGEGDAGRPTLALSRVAPGALRRLLEPRIAALSRELAWHTVRRDSHRGHQGDLRDVERVAVLAGVKPGLRRSYRRAADAEGLAEELRREGLEARVASEIIRWRGDERHHVVYASPDPALVRRLIALEDAGLPERSDAPRAVLAERHRELGAALGYPPCCVDAFVTRNIVPARRLLGPRTRRLLELVSPPAHDRFEAARTAWCVDPLPELNPFFAGERRTLISFEPCSYRCAAALSLARATERAAAAVDEKAARLLREALVAPVAVDAAGHVARLGLRGRGRRTMITHAEAVSPEHGKAPEPEARAWANGLVGRRSPGRVPYLGAARWLLLDFRGAPRQG